MTDLKILMIALRDYLEVIRDFQKTKTYLSIPDKYRDGLCVYLARVNCPYLQRYRIMNLIMEEVRKVNRFAYYYDCPWSHGSYKHNLKALEKRVELIYKLIKKI